MTQNNYGLHIHLPGALPGLAMFGGGGSNMKQPSPDRELQGPKTGAIGVKGPWHINPGNPNFPNHRPYLTNPKPPSAAAPVPSQMMKPV